MSDEPQQHDEGTPGREPERPADAAPPPSAEGDRSAGRPADPDARPPRRPATGPAGGASDAPGPAARPSGTPGGRPADDKGRSAPPA
ncbi:hypothetical protein OG711_25165 [Streptomyces uncialis]|uniref:hypothetical protein n=1 Tax=Streptomyces uncialis TaxID=1048205 RepID=UPI002E313C05|nr:hypothetical protein [Streptomyces uncialis]